MISEEKIIIDLSSPVRIHSNRTLSVASLLVGRKVEEALGLLPVVFSLCAHAHVAAANAAIGLKTTDKSKMLILAENAREHLLRILLGWQVDGADIIPAAPVMSLVNDTLNASEKSAQIQIANQLEIFLKTHIFGCSLEHFLQENFLKWLKITNTLPASYLRKIVANDWQGDGCVIPDFLPELSASELALDMQKDSFCLQPVWEGNPKETGSLARQYKHNIVVDIVKEHGAGLMARMVARLVELAQIPQQMRQRQASIKIHKNIGIVETARGRLIHFAQVKKNIITNYKILAPTEWNFHPEGVVAQSLVGLAPARAKHIVEAIDPCVEFELRVA